MVLDICEKIYVRFHLSVSYYFQERLKPTTKQLNKQNIVFIGKSHHKLEIIYQAFYLIL